MKIQFASDFALGVPWQLAVSEVQPPHGREGRHPGHGRFYLGLAIHIKILQATELEQYVAPFVMENLKSSSERGLLHCTF